MFCKNCGNEIAEGMRFCTSCGTPASEAEEVVIPAQEPVETAPVAEEPEQIMPEVPAEEPAAEEIMPEIPAEEPVVVPPVQEPVVVPPEVAKYVEAKKPKKKKKGKGVLITVIVVVLVAALGVGGWFGYNWWQDSQDYDQAVSLLADKEYDKALALFKDLGDFEDSAAQVKKLEGWQKDYDRAVKLLNDGKYAEAGKAFKELEEYRDSKELAQYAEAQDAFSTAESIEDYMAAGELFAAMGDYKDCEAMASKCYLEAAFAAVEDGDEDALEACLEKLNDEDLALFEGSYHDEELLKTWEEALEVRYEMENSDESGFDYTEELELLEPCTEMACRNKTLEKLLKEYYELVEEQQDNLDEDGYVADWVSYYELELERSIILDELNEEYDFLEDNEELLDWYIGWQDFYEECIAIESSLQAWYEEVELQEEDGKHYVEYTNDTEYEFTLTLHFYYYDDQGELISEEQLMGSLKSGETLRFYMELPEEAETWDVDSYFSRYEEMDLETGA